MRRIYYERNVYLSHLPSTFSVPKERGSASGGVLPALRFIPTWPGGVFLFALKPSTRPLVLPCAARMYHISSRTAGLDLRTPVEPGRASRRRWNGEHAGLVATRHNCGCC